MVKYFFAAISSIVLGGCAAPALQEPRLQIENRSGKIINQIVYRECGTEAGEWLPFKVATQLPSNYVTFIDLPVDCADLQAFFVGGRIAGTQQNIKKKFPFKWSLH